MMSYTCADLLAIPRKWHPLFVHTALCVEQQFRANTCLHNHGPSDGTDRDEASGQHAGPQAGPGDDVGAKERCVLGGMPDPRARLSGAESSGCSCCPCGFLRTPTIRAPPNLARRLACALSGPHPNGAGSSPDFSQGLARGGGRFGRPRGALLEPGAE